MNNDNNGPRRSCFASALLVLLLHVANPCCGQHPGDHANSPERPAREYSTSPISSSDVGRWRADLDFLIGKIEELHPEPYRRFSEAEFHAAVAGIKEEIPQLASHEILVRFAQLLALVGDGHTSLPLYAANGIGFHVLPCRFGIYGTEVYIEAADQAYSEIVGGRVMQIGGVPIHEALSRATPLISRDNDNWIGAVAPFLLNRIEVLHALGLSEDLREGELVVEKDGKTFTTTIKALPDPPREHLLAFRPEYTANWIDARDLASSAAPLYQSNFEQMYFWQYLPKEDLLYIKWDQVQNRASGPTALEVFREAMAFAREQLPSKTVIDIRNNTGGEGTLGIPIIREVVRTREIDEPGKLFVVIGRRTFSAGQMLTAWFQQFTSAILVGEPSSAYYNGYAGHVHAVLPNSQVTISIAPDYYQLSAIPRDTRQQATPRLAARPTFEAYLANRDVALETILDYSPSSLRHDVLHLLTAGETAAAKQAIQDFAAMPVNEFISAKSELNALGYELIRQHQLELAVTVMQLNVSVHPHYANGWDSLGEALLQLDRREEAVSAFRKAIEISPGLETSLRWLEHLDVDQN
mgnify:CR=1 FL=1